MPARWSAAGRLGVILLLTAQAEYSPDAIVEPRKPVGPAYAGFVLVHGGSFQMGDLFADGPFAMRELPIHEVQLNDFLLEQFEVTVSEFGRFVAAMGYRTVAEVDAGLHPGQAVVQQSENHYPSLA